MRPWSSIAIALSLAGGAVAPAFAQGTEPAPMPIPTEAQPPPSEQQPPPEAPPPDAKPKEKKPKRGDFDAGGQARFPSGPDEMNEYATFNWVAVDVKGQYYLLDFIKLSGTAPLAIIKPDLVNGVEPKLLGGFTAAMEIELPTNFAPKMYQGDVGLLVAGSYMREGALLLSEKDFPLFLGDMQPGFSGGLTVKLKVSSLLDFSLVPVWVYQSGTEDAYQAVQIPMSLILKVGDTVKVAADLGVFTGDDYSGKGVNGGRISAGGALDVKLGPILAHAGAGVASLLTGGLYPTIRDSVYIDLNVKYAK